MLRSQGCLWKGERWLSCRGWEVKKGGLVKVEMINDSRGLADRMSNLEEEPMGEVVRRLVNLEGWGLDDMVEQDTSVWDRFWLGGRACTRCRHDRGDTHGFCSHRTKTRRHKFRCEERKG